MSNSTPRPSPRRAAASAQESTNKPGPASANDTEETLADTAREEREYLRSKLRDELGREPTEEEADQWLRQHTEGY